MHALIILALNCGIGTFPQLDPNGNEVCVGSQSGQVREIQGSLRDCPTGMIPQLTPGGSACVDPRTGAAAYDIRRECPNGTARYLTVEGEVCR